MFPTNHSISPGFQTIFCLIFLLMLFFLLVLSVPITSTSGKSMQINGLILMAQLKNHQFHETLLNLKLYNSYPYSQLAFVFFKKLILW
jgi:hypothetical protein